MMQSGTCWWTNFVPTGHHYNDRCDGDMRHGQWASRRFQLHSLMSQQSHSLSARACIFPVSVSCHKIAHDSGTLVSHEISEHSEEVPGSDDDDIDTFRFDSVCQSFDL